MVSFSCENCGDVLTKKKLDSHRNQCRGASFTCLDCMTHFWDTEYKAHTSCISEAQKYQGALYKEKPTKKKTVRIIEAAPTPRKAYVEDAPDQEYDNAVVVVSAPPHAPSPPRGAATEPVNVFDFLVNDETPNASRLSLGGSKEQMCMVDHAPPLFKSLSGSPDEGMSQTSEANNFKSQGYSYGTEPILTNGFDPYQTPAPKAITYEIKPRDTKSADKKRKRQIEDLDLTQARRSSQELDEVMVDADTHPPVLHSGLTGGLNRLLSTSKFPPSPDYSGGSGADPSPLSPAKRKRQPGVVVEKRGRRAGQLVKVRKVRRSSDESRPRKHHRSQRHGDRHEERSPNDRKRVVKAIEYPRSVSPNAHDGNQLIVYRSRAEHFLSFVNKGPESESGCSINKALKRYHRERSDQGLGYGKQEEEKELWKSLRLKRNDRGEVVVIM